VPSNAVLDVLAARWRPNTNEPLVIGIGGGSGAGKSTVAAHIADALRPRSVHVVNQDQFFKAPSAMPTYDSALHCSGQPDFNHPDSFERDEMVAFCTGLSGHDVVIIEGILVLHFAELRSLMHLKCYVTIELEEMLVRRTERNLAAGYGGSREEIHEYNTLCVTKQHRRFNAPTASHADVLIPNDNGRSEDRDRIIADIQASVRTFWRQNG
jgi:uridine kinase